MSFLKYSEYRHSGITWLGEVPVHWQSWKVAHAFQSIGSGTTPPSGEENWYCDDHGYPWVTTGELKEKQILGTAKQVTGEALNAFSSLRIHPSGSLVIALYGATIGRLAILGIDATTNQACCVLAKSHSLHTRFVFYWFQAFREILVALYAYGGGQPNISQDTISSIRIPAPIIDDQITIAAFLDHETAKIDALMEEQKRLIKLLKEKRQAMISQAVTKGLDPNVPMKDSGVEWLGEVPEHWDVKSISKVTCKITNGYVGPTRDILVPSGVPYIQATHIKHGKILFDDAYFVTPEWSRSKQKSILKSGDVLIVQTGAGTGDVGLVSPQEEGYNCHALIVLQPITGALTGDFLSKVLRSTYGASALYSIRTGGMHPHLNCSDVKFLKIPVPGVREQQEITAYINQFINASNELQTTAEEQVRLLNERRSALISAAVTGKIDVRNA